MTMSAFASMWMATPAPAEDLPPHALAASTADSKMTVDHASFDALLARVVVPSADGINRVDYAGLRNGGQAVLDAYLGALQSVDPTRLGPAEHSAYFANLYNAATLAATLPHYPVKSIKDIRLPDTSGALQDGPWKTKLVTVNGAKLTLNEIAGAILRPTLMKRDPRGHYLLNCLSLGCPNLLPEAITGAKLEKQMTGAATAFARHPRGLSVANGKAKASSLYTWYEADFGGQAGLIAHLKAVGGPEVSARLAGIEAISDFDYDWALADAAVR